MMYSKHLSHSKLSNVPVLLRENIWRKPFKVKKAIHNNYNTLKIGERLLLLYFSVRVPCGTPRPHGSIILKTLNSNIFIYTVIPGSNQLTKVPHVNFWNPFHLFKNEKWSHKCACISIYYAKNMQPCDLKRRKKAEKKVYHQMIRLCVMQNSRKRLMVDLTLTKQEL